MYILLFHSVSGKECNIACFCTEFPLLCLYVNQNQTRAWNAQEIQLDFTLPQLINQMCSVG